jgi:hypothetical protein
MGNREIQLSDSNLGSGNGPGPFAGSESLYNQLDPRRSLQFLQAQRLEQPGGSQEAVIPGSARIGEQMLPPRDTPEGKEFYKAMKSPGGSLNFSTPVDNAASGATPDYRLVEQDGKLQLVRTGQGDPMSDGGMNVEIDTGNKNLQDYIEQNDKNTKEFARQMIAYWQKNHPGEPVPSHLQAILDKQPPQSFTPKPTPITRTPLPQPNVPEPSPQAQQPSWQNDYRGGGGTGYGRSGYGGGRGTPGGDSYYGGGRPGSEYNLPSNVPQFRDNAFIDKVTNTVMANEGALTADGKPKFTAYNPDDNGGISVGIRQWHAGGALPELLNAWQAADPQKFQEYFKGYTPAQINSMNSQQFAATPGMEEGMKKALEDPRYQQVQAQLMQDWVKREVKTAMDSGLTGEREIATYVDIANQLGQEKAQQVALLGKGKGDQSDAMSQAARGGESERQARINANFSTENASLTPATPNVGQFNERLARAAEVWDSRMPGTGWCARAVQRALADAGLRQFLGSGDAWNMLGPLKRSGLFAEVPMDQAQRGDIILRQSSTGYYGDISVVTARNGNRIQQTNDATYEFRPNNPRYSRSVFLRYVGDQQSSGSEQPEKKSNG